MVEFADLELTEQVKSALPPWSEAVAYLARAESRHSVATLRGAMAAGRPVVQPRCGVGGHDEMLTLLRHLDGAGPGILSVTIDSHTRLKRFDTAARLMRHGPADLNGYPLVAHGWARGRELGAAVGVPLEVRHGSPEPQDLFAVAIASGISSFEGGGIGYNLPYSKSVPLLDSLRAWQRVDAACGRLAAAGVVVDREFFGTLTAVMVPPSISIAVVLIEAVAALREGVRCFSLAYPQGGEPHQDVAALRSIRVLARRYLGPGAEVFPVLHEFMGVFPRTPEFADSLILCGGLIGRLGGAAKVVNKTRQESAGIPDAEANAAGIRTARRGASTMFDFVRLDEERVAEEQHWIEREVAELVDPVLERPDLLTAVSDAFADGTLDIPFSASVYARSEIVPRRDRDGCIRYGKSGSLPFSAATLRHNADRLALGPARSASVIESVTADIHYFLDQEARSLPED
ncbi:methylaspartate mutase [Actinokineospora globicatena]|uniref:Methylaspartate mutase n=1 Tax=Actinokineospora globicatena TaxID=103729 RepID=A0A9W6QGW7_9PSEU|nr:methylaspartate mutase [Actinokineospora globicatena]GLW89861.1 methylaspartate mutase [Actinokineospora globicatena]